MLLKCIPTRKTVSLPVFLLMRPACLCAISSSLCPGRVITEDAPELPTATAPICSSPPVSVTSKPSPILCHLRMSFLFPASFSIDSTYIALYIR
ncbi:hypothetical protein MPF_1521 [Methanohalophilus portucalensis FDF-1]|uniref:Uncharacterized protein n=1 Tax=Methanohalophilus portucalensis FDF-1 TaxID=523843 RepID=A0A1L9C397_9EURY|nr:hypothetical protein MPF_1521 [Methanohalophilus portucalensis FDF-1]